MARSYGQYCALARALDVVGDRWTLLILRNLLLGGQRYTELVHGLPGIATNLLADRLRSLQENGLVVVEGDVYELTEVGRDLQPALFALSDWGERHWMGAPREGEHFRLRYAMTALRRHMRATAEARTVQLFVETTPFVVRCGPAPEVYAGIAADADEVAAVTVAGLGGWLRGDVSGAPACVRAALR